MYANRLLLVLVVSAFLLSPVIVNWFAARQEFWYQPFLLWLAVIAIVFWMMRSQDLHD